MNAVATMPTDAVSLALPDDLTLDAWWQIGREMLGRRRNLDWMLADWVNAGVERFGDQIEFGFLGENLGVDPKTLQVAAKTSKAFPASQRDSSLSMEHHQVVADLSAEERMCMLKRAHEEHWTPKQTRVEVMKRKVATGQTTIFADDDFEHHELMAITRAWNRARSSVRQSFIELAAEAELGDIDA